MKIEISTNCKNGEHVFIPASTLTEGRENLVTSFVCQHCLQGVSNNDWNAHLNKLEDQATEKDNQRTIHVSTVGKAGDVLNYETLQFEAPKKRGPKPKQKEIEGL